MKKTNENSKKRTGSALLALVVSLVLLATSCSLPGKPKTFDLARIQGLPLAYPIVGSALESLGIDSRNLAFSGYQELYSAIAQGEADIIFTGKPAARDLSLLEGTGTVLKCTPLWSDALVFTVSLQNPANDVSSDGIKALVNGETLSWDEWGLDCPVHVMASGKALVDPEWGFADLLPMYPISSTLSSFVE